MKAVLFCIFLINTACGSLSSVSGKTGNVIFIHPDGMSLAHWDAVRLIHAGYEGKLNFDKFSNTAVYRGTIRQQITATSNAGATIHAFGIKTGADSFGMDKGKNIMSKSGEPYSILISAQKKGIKTALCQSGVLVEPGTAVFVSQVKSRKYKDEIAKQVIESGVDLIFGGGEKYLLPKGVQGHFGLGERKDQINLIERAKEMGYTVIYDLKNFEKVKSHSKILGVFAHDDTYNDDDPIEVLKTKGFYQQSAPTIGEMTQMALQFLKQKNQQFLLIVEEEGTDNFSNRKNTEGFLTAGKRADEAFGVAFDFLKKNQNTLLLTTSDSNAGGLVMKEVSSRKDPVFYTYPKTAYDFKKPSEDKALPFSIQWGSGGPDSHGGIVVKAQGLNAHYVKGLLDNTGIYDLMYLTLFGRNVSPSEL
ncbi:MAG: alkaline phosphatase [Bdellovibrionales bacterium]|nr:alkaline phosphatase [Bdellovibrionales bacterium]